MINAFKLEHEIRSGIIQSIVVFESTLLTYTENRYRYVGNDRGNQIWEHQRIELHDVEIKSGCLYPSRSKSDHVETITVDKVVRDVCQRYVLLHNYNEKQVRIVIGYEDTKLYLLIKIQHLLETMCNLHKEEQLSALMMLEKLTKIEETVDKFYDNTTMTMVRNSESISAKIKDLKKSIMDTLKDL